jgi:glycoside/pentoside/hexuronide:cation symporter, GPH family
MSTSPEFKTTAPPSRTDMLSYSAPMMACYFLLGPTYNIVPTLYAKYFGLQLTTVAMVVLLTRVLDAFSDPLIGYLSDRHRREGGTRKAWVVGGAALIMVAACFLFSPPGRASAAYYLTWNLTFFIAYSLMEIPHVTWGGELTRDYSARSTVYSFRSAAIFCGFILWAGFPLLPLFATQEFTPQVLQNIGYAGCALVVLTMAWSAVRAPGGTPFIPQQRDSWRTITRSVILNRPLWLLLLGYLFCVLALGMWQVLVFLYLDSHMGLGGRFALMQLLSNVAALLVIPAWKYLAQKFDKSTIWMLSMGLFILFNSGFAMLQPGTPWWQVWVLMALIHTCFACLYMIVPSILSDVVDYGELRFRQNRGGTYFALNNLLSKAGFGVGGALALALAGHYGVDATQSQQTARAVQGLQLAYVFLPIVLAIISSIFIWLIPIDRRRHSIVCRRIQSRARRLATAASSAAEA